MLLFTLTPLDFTKFLSLNSRPGCLIKSSNFVKYNVQILFDNLRVNMGNPAA